MLGAICEVIMMANKIRKGTAFLKVSATSQKDINRFCDNLQKIYKLLLIGKMIPSDDGGVHCYINVDLDSEVKTEW
jgi:hypothetical protein